MFESLSDKLKKTLRDLRGLGKLTPEHVDAALREIRMALLEADVNYKVAKEFVESVRAKAEGQEVWQGLNPHEQVVKIVRRSFVSLWAALRHGSFLQSRSERRDDRRAPGLG